VRANEGQAMKSGRCPFCWSGNVRRALPLACSRPLVECGDCEKWFWGDSGEEVQRLFEFCATPVTRPSRCDAAIREAMNSGGNGFPRRRAAEFNRLCSDCLHARFLCGEIDLAV